MFHYPHLKRRCEELTKKYFLNHRVLGITDRKTHDHVSPLLKQLDSFYYSIHALILKISVITSVVNYRHKKSQGLQNFEWQLFFQPHSSLLLLLFVIHVNFPFRYHHPKLLKDFFKTFIYSIYQFYMKEVESLRYN